MIYNIILHFGNVSWKKESEKLFTALKKYMIGQKHAKACFSDLYFLWCFFRIYIYFRSTEYDSLYYYVAIHNMNICFI